MRVLSASIAGIMLFSALLFCPRKLVAGEDLPLWDNAVNQLLAAGLYGVSLDEPSLKLELRQDDRDIYRNLLHGSDTVHAPSITLSYSGSSGLLGFSAGFIYTSGASQGNFGSVFLDLNDPMRFGEFDPERSWYMALDLSTSYQAHDDIMLGFSGRGMLLGDPYNPSAQRHLSLLFNMPVTYKKYITITPELQWSRPLSNHSLSGKDNGHSGTKKEQDSFYGGVSISFSY